MTAALRGATLRSSSDSKLKDWLMDSAEIIGRRPANRQTSSGVGRAPRLGHRRGSTGSLSSASAPKTHSCTRRNSSLLMNRSWPSTPNFGCGHVFYTEADVTWRDNSGYVLFALRQQGLYWQVVGAWLAGMLGVMTGHDNSFLMLIRVLGSPSSRHLKSLCNCSAATT
jgi:hypothetical protein